uniref:Uncharacterized protein n=1 Tax=Amphimedon queenslandica TaxID=400682 RepID=A0A1X7T2U5_AMPQE
MLYNVHKIIKIKPPPLDDVKEFLRCLEKECSLINIKLLQSLVEEFNIKKAEKYITDYKAILKKFCHTVKITLCLNEKFEALGGSPSLQCETVTYVFDWEPDEHILQDIKQIISKTSGKLVKIKYIKKGNSIIVTCSFPHSLTGALIIKLSENLELLIKNGLMKLTVGYCTIWKEEMIQEIQEPLEEEVQEMKEQPHDTKRQKELDGTAQQLANILSEKEKVYLFVGMTCIGGINTSIYPIVGVCCYNRMKKEYHIKCCTDFTSASYKIIKGMRMEIEQILTNKTGLLDQNESLIDIKREIAELQEQISLLSVHILNKREKNEELMHKIKDYKRDTLKLDQEISSEQTIDKREEDEQVIHQEIKEQLDRLIINVESHQTKEPSNTSREKTGKVEWGSYKVHLTKPSTGQCQEVISQLTDSHQDINLYHSSPDIVYLLMSLALDLTITRIRIYYTKITKDVILLLSHKITNNTSLKTLSISNYSINDDGVIALTQSLINNKTIAYLFLRDNPDITSTSAQSLAELLLYNHTLSFLWLERTNIDTDGVLVLMESLCTNNTLGRLYLDNKHKQTCYSLPYYKTIENRLGFVV